ncbi:MAG: hypothetical protein ACOC0N_02235 [Chroococcales cyanobacterium]
MSQVNNLSSFQEIIEATEALSVAEQEMLLDILQKRLREQKRENLAKEIKEIRQDYDKGNVKFGSVDDFLLDLDN